jgi:hypothetical protein
MTFQLFLVCCAKVTLFPVSTKFLANFLAWNGQEQAKGSWDGGKNVTSPPVCPLVFCFSATRATRLRKNGYLCTMLCTSCKEGDGAAVSERQSGQPHLKDRLS